jgi:Uma2 family endonuclease
MYVSPQEYLENERLATARSAYVSGEIIPRRVSPRHALIAANVAGVIGNQLQRDRCHVFGSLLRVCIRWGSLITYPDVSVLCDKAEYVDEERDTVTNPTLIVEVLSPSTRSYDRGEKARLFRMVPSLREFLLVEQETVEVEHWRRLPNGNWELATVRESGVTLRLESIGCDLPIDEIYRGSDEYLAS